MQIFGNLCISLAALIYLLPLQHLLLEFARKRDDGGGAIAGMMILGPMWLLLLAGVLAAAAHGGFNGLPVRRGLPLYATIIAATIALAVVTFISFACLNRPTWTVRLTLGLPIYVIPPLTIALVAIALNPGLGARLPLAAVRLPWMVIAGLSLVGCVGYLGFAATRRVTGAVAQAIHSAGGTKEFDAKVRAQLPTLDPDRDFAELLKYAADAGSAEIRAMATARLRASPRLTDHIAEALMQSDPTKPITFLAETDLSQEEKRQLAQPLYQAMQGYGEYIHQRLHYYPKEWKQEVRAWGRSTYPRVASKFSGNNPDFSGLPAEFDQAFVPNAR
jgi:hypothetical protein